MLFLFKNQPDNVLTSWKYDFIFIVSYLPEKT